jgi:cell fate (sporulation/competence/biofilm development) regulator YlbF (YheA/YmcA/DUF963 family)
MTTWNVSDLEIAPASVIRQAARDLASVLAATAQFQAFEEASACLRQDAAAQQSMRAYQEKQRALQALLLLGVVGPEERAELERLQQVFVHQSAVVAYRKAEADLRALFQTTADQLSRMIDFDFAAACSTGCC